MKKRSSLFALALASVGTAIFFQNCNSSSTSLNQDSKNISLSDEFSFNKSLIDLLVFSSVPNESPTDFHKVFKVPTVACVSDDPEFDTFCIFIFSADQVYKSNLPQTINVDKFLRSHSFPSYLDENGSSYVYVRDVVCTIDLLNANGAICNYKKDFCEEIQECIPGYQEQLEPKTPKNVALINTSSLKSAINYSAFIPLNNPTNWKLKIDLSEGKNQTFGGEVLVSFIDGGNNHYRIFKTSLGVNNSFESHPDYGELESQFNYWFSYNGHKVFSGFFEDTYGSIVITLEPLDSIGNTKSSSVASAGQVYKGHVFFKNFTLSYGVRPSNLTCWYTYSGPYSCRSTSVQDKSTLYPETGSGYELLGTFEIEM